MPQCSGAKIHYLELRQMCIRSVSLQKIHYSLVFLPRESAVLVHAAEFHYYLVGYPQNSLLYG